MKQVNVYRDELYPAYALCELRTTRSRPATITDEMWTRYRRVTQRFEELQKELRSIYFEQIGD